MILFFVDPDGDPVAVESDAIVGVTVGRITGPRAAEQVAQGTVTLIHTSATVDRPFMVASTFTDVVQTWATARETPPGAQTAIAHPGVFPLVEHQYPDGVR